MVYNHAYAEQLKVELAKITNSEYAAEQAIEAILFAAQSSRWQVDRVYMAYRMYLLSGRPAYTPEGLASVALKAEKINLSMGREIVSLEDAVLNGKQK